MRRLKRLISSLVRQLTEKEAVSTLDLIVFFLTSFTGGAVLTTDAYREFVLFSVDWVVGFFWREPLGSIAFVAIIGAVILDMVKRADYRRSIRKTWKHRR